MDTKFFSKRNIILIIGFLFALWIFAFRDFFLYKARLFPDGWSYLYWIKFFIDNISQGVYPLWHPLENFGYPIGYKIRFIGEFNPFLLIPFALYKLGINFSIAYFIFAVSYYFLGLIGFYLLAKHLFKSSFYGLLSLIMLLFSATGIAIFFNYCEVVLMVPGIWFFYFMIKFHENQLKSHALGAMFCIMIIMVTYMPFYFFTILFTFLFCYLILYFKECVKFSRNKFRFISNNKLFALICFILVALSIMPGYLWYTQAGSGDLAFDQRHSSSEVKNIATLGFKMISLGTIVGPLTIKKLFSGLMYQSNQLSYFFLPFFVYPILLLSIFNKLSRRMIICFVVGFVAFIISLTDITPLHEVLFKNVFYFKLIRNIYYLLYLALPFIVLFIVDQLKMLLEHQPKGTAQKGLWVGFIALSHICFYKYLAGLGEILMTTWVTLVGSAIFFTIHFLGLLENRVRLKLILLVALLVVQPVSVFHHYCQNADTRFDFKYREVPERVVFHYLRPNKGEPGNYGQDQLVETSGFHHRYVGPAWTNTLLKKVPHSYLKDYMRHKFIAYDRVEVLSEEDIQWPKVGFALSQSLNVALVSDKEAKAFDRSETKTTLKWAQKIVDDSEEFSVLDFSLNHITFKTNFKTSKFLVYNDSYHPDWKVWINNKPGKIYRANFAFKGLWLGAGEQVVRMQFQGLGTRIFYFFLIVLFYGAFVYFLVLRFKERKAVETLS